MLPIAIQNGRHSSLPPLLLPDVFRPTPSYDPFLRTKRHFSSLGAGADAPALSVPPVALGPTPHTLVAADAGLGVTSLESLASLATKRRKLQLAGSRGAISHALAPASAAAAAVSAVTPPAVHPESAATTQGAAAHGAPARETPAVPSPPSSVGSITPHEKRIVPASAPVASMAPLSDNKSAAAAAQAVGDMRSKRQRIGPSCDSCRLKKIKCDASIEILYQDECIVALGSDSLHVQLTPEDCAQLPCKVREALPRSVLEHVTGQARDPDLALVKHVDKLVAFRPCSSCAKRCSGAGSAGGPATATAAAAVECQFSKGLTRADINVFTRLERQLGPRDKLASFTVGDYRLVGY
ncbi:LAFE_0B07558g1_1 [Lachancea fermentati]|uniref:LAFE_0B07558g1_1 n=1 Tax=Lachancea fermentati TaxID=4955 RepID=A0A1G4M884_LACFM|nr:LAFE_0B07558g1_1 [Lachancea fermentati]